MMKVEEILRKLVSFNTIKDKDNCKIINYIEKILKEKGFVTEYKTKGLIMSIKNRQTVGFLGHTDTVSYGDNWKTNPFKLTKENNKIFGLGVCDMKGGIAGFLKAVCDIDWKKMKKGVKLYFTYDEEINFSGIKEFIEIKQEFPKIMIIAEPTNNVIMNGSKGLLELKISFIGKASHASMPTSGKNAIEQCLNFLNELINFYNNNLKIEKYPFEIPYTTMNIGKINGGTSINIVPKNCEVYIDFRICNDNHINIILNEIEKILKKYDANLEILNNIKCFTNTNEKIVSTNFITEASFINCNKKYILGVGPINPHTTNEYITEDSLEKLVEQYKEIIYKNCK